MPDGPRYDDDFYAWTQYQAEVLRSMPGNDERFDRENVAEEIESLGRSELHDVWSLARRIITQFLLLANGPLGNVRYGYMREILLARAELEDKMSPTIWLLTQAELPDLYEDGRKIAELRLRELGATEAAYNLPKHSSYSLDDICQDDWYPEPAKEPK